MKLISDATIQKAVINIANLNQRMFRKNRVSRRKVVEEGTSSDQNPGPNESEEEDYLNEINRINQAERKLDEIIFVKKRNPPVQDSSGVSPGKRNAQTAVKLNTSVDQPTTPAVIPRKHFSLQKQKKADSRNKMLADIYSEAGKSRAEEATRPRAETFTHLKLPSPKSPTNQTEKETPLNQSFVAQLLPINDSPLKESYFDRSSLHRSVNQSIFVQEEFLEPAARPKLTVQTQSNIGPRQKALAFETSSVRDFSPTPRFSKVQDTSSIVEFSQDQQVRSFIRKGKEQPPRAQLPTSSLRAISPNKPKECRKQFYHNKVQGAIKGKAKFTDEMFPATDSAVYSKGLGKDSVLPLFQIQWIRAKKHFQRLKPSLFKYIDPSDLKPGHFSCQFMTNALSILAQRPHILQAAAEGQNLNLEGIYVLRLKKEGVLRYFLLDDLLPFSKRTQTSSRQVLATRGYGSGGQWQFWPSLFQKGVAKLYGCYQNVHRAKSCAELVQLFTLASAESIPFETKAIKEQLGEDSLIYLQSCRVDKGQLTKGLSYAVLAVEGFKLVLRQAGLAGVGPDQVRLSLDECRQLFERVVVFRERKGWHYLSVGVRHGSRLSRVVTVKVREQTQLQIKLHVQLQASVPRGKERSFSTSVGLGDREQSCQLRTKLSKGTHRVVVHCCESPSDLNLSIYSSQPVEVDADETKAAKCCG